MPTQQELDDAWHNFLLTAQRTPAYRASFEIDFRREGGFAVFIGDASKTTFPLRLLEDYRAYRRAFDRCMRSQPFIYQAWRDEGHRIATGRQEGLSDDAFIDISHEVEVPEAGRFSCVYALMSAGHTEQSPRLIGQTKDAHAQESAHRLTSDEPVIFYPLYVPSKAELDSSDKKQEEVRIIVKHILVVMCGSTLPNAQGRDHGRNTQVLDNHSNPYSTLPELPASGKKRSAADSDDESRVQKAARREA